MTAMRPTRRNRCRSRRNQPASPSDQPMSRPARPLPRGRGRAAARNPATTRRPPCRTIPNSRSACSTTPLCRAGVHHTLQAVAEPDEADEADADDDGSRRRHAAACGRSGRARQQLPSRRRPRACPRLARPGARQHRRDHPVEGAGAVGPRTDRGRAGATAALHRLRRYGTGAELLPPPRRG